MRHKTFDLISGCEDRHSWRISTHVRENETFATKGGIQVINNKEFVEKYKQIKQKSDAKKRGLGYIPINDWEEDLEMHHIDSKHVIFIPERVHEICSGFSLQIHREKVMGWLKLNDKELYLKVNSLIKKEGIR